MLANLALVQNLTGAPSLPAPLWSLPFELQMYVVLPVLFLLLRRFRSLWVPFALWASAVAIVLVVGFAGRWDLAALLWFTPCFLGGIIGYRLWPTARMKLPFWVWPLVITLCIALRVMAVGSSDLVAILASAWVACLLLGLAAPQFREPGSGVVRALAAQIAKYSYGIYLSQVAVLWIAFVVLRSEPIWLQAAAGLALSIALPVAMYHAVERPMIRLGARAARLLAGVSSATAPARAELGTGTDP